MTPIIDIHTHHRDRRCAVLSVEPQDFAPQAGMLYSVGYHPWNPVPESTDKLVEAASHPQVVALGETGLDSLRGATLAEQIVMLEQHIDLAKQLGKPVVAHMVRTSQQLITTWRKMKPRGIDLVVHGMRGNENVARALIDEGFYLSYGERFNSRALLATPLERILAETDESEMNIDTIVANMASVLGMSAEELANIVRTNAQRVLRT